MKLGLNVAKCMWKMKCISWIFLNGMSTVIFGSSFSKPTRRLEAFDATRTVHTVATKAKKKKFYFKLFDASRYDILLVCPGELGCMAMVPEWDILRVFYTDFFE